MYATLARRTNRGHGKISLLPWGLALKRKSRENPQPEAAATRFIHRNTTIPVPEIFDVIQYQTSSDTNSCDGLIVMEEIEGQTLDKWIADRTGWSDEYMRNFDLIMSREGDADTILPFLSSQEPTVDWCGAEQLFADLCDVFHQLRSLAPPYPQVISGVTGGPLFSIRRDADEFIGPFSDVREFHRYLTSLVCFPSRMPRLMKLADPVYKKQQRICFTHADIHGGNVIVRDDRLVAVIDWEQAGWYPEYFERTQIRRLQGVANKANPEFWETVGYFKGMHADELLLEDALDASTGNRARNGGRVLARRASPRRCIAVQSVDFTLVANILSLSLCEAQA
jgi:hypothetical protein